MSGSPRDGILGLLYDARREAGEPEYGAREIEVADLCSRGEPYSARDVLRTLTRLRREGLVVRRSGWVWLSEPAFEALSGDDRR